MGQHLALMLKYHALSNITIECVTNEMSCHELCQLQKNGDENKLMEKTFDKKIAANHQQNVVSFCVILFSFILSFLFFENVAHSI